MIPTIASTLMCFALQQGVSQGGESSGSAESAPAPPEQVDTATALRGPMGIRMNRSGRVESAKSEKLDWAPEGFRGEVQVERVDKVSGTVSAGEVILVLTPVDGELQRQLEDAQRNLDFARQRAALAERERAMHAERSAQNVERTARALENAARALARWDEYARGKTLEMSELNTQAQVDRLADEREELTQLEKLYEGATLDGQTRDIVLERARRSLKRSERYTHYGLIDGDYYRAVEFLEQDKNVREAARNAEVDARHALESQAIGEARAVMGAAEAAEQIDGAERHLAKLSTDRDALQVKAPIAGIMSVVSEQAGDRRGANAQFATVFDPNMLQIPLTIPAEATRFAAVGTPVTIHFPDLPDRNCSGRIAILDPVGRPEGDGTVFSAVVALTPGSQPPPIGLAAKVLLEGTLNDVLQVPAKALRKNADGDDALRVKRGEVTVEVPVILGVRQGGMVEVVSGIAAGEQVIVGGS